MQIQYQRLPNPDDKNLLLEAARHHPTRLTSHEVDKIKEYVTDKRFAHFSIASLSIYAKKQADVFASPISWSRIIRKFKLRRPLKRIYPRKPKVGIRASFPNRIWHIDISIIKLQDGQNIALIRATAIKVIEKVNSR